MSDDSLSPMSPEAPSPGTSDNGPTEESGQRFLIRNIIYTIIGILVLIALVAAARRLLGDRLAVASNWLTTQGGYWGVFLSTWAIDTFTLPLSPDVILAFVAHEGGKLDHATSLVVISAASVLGGNTAYYLARWLGGTRWVQRRLAKGYDNGQKLFRRFGVWAVVIAGLTPVPFSIVCWLAGLYRMSAFKLFLATLSRIPRFVGWYYLIRFGFSL